MPDHEEALLKFYLERTGGVNADLPFEQWCQRRHTGNAGEAEYQATLDRARVYVKGYEAGWKAHRDHVAQAFYSPPDSPRPPFDVQIS